MTRNIHTALAALFLICACTSDTVAPINGKLAPAPSVDVIVLGTGPDYLPRSGFQSGILEDINNAGTKVGTHRSLSGVNQAVKYDAVHHLFILPTPTGSHSRARGVNDLGYVVGSYVSSSGIGRGVYWDPGGLAVPLVGSGGSGTGAYDVNENGLIVGVIQSGTGTTDRAGYWNLGGEFTQLQLPFGAQGSHAFAVNDDGDIVGYAIFAGPQDLRPILWKAPAYTPQLLSVPAGFVGGMLRGISNSGVMVGSLFTSSGSGISLRPAVWGDAGSSPAVISGADQVAHDVNERGIVVGGSSAAFAWSPQTGLLVLSPNGIATGMAINDRGEVVGYERIGNIEEPTRWSVAIQSDDRDADGVPDSLDNCPAVPNAGQDDMDNDGMGDNCDPFPQDPLNDVDQDGVGGEVDNAPDAYNPDQADGDRDGIGDVADNCPAVSNPDQRDEDRDGIGDACERNTPPTITELTGPAGPLQLVSGSATATIVVAFTDPDQGDTHETTIDCYRNGSYVTGSNCHYAQPGVYTVSVTVTDNHGNADTETFEFVVVYDPSGGFVTGGGWIKYSGTACPVLCGNIAGRADFGFVSKYLKGATVPSGDTRFEFHTGTLQFVSTSYEWLVVAGARGQFKGRGVINGSGDYGFLLTAVDGSLDKFRIKIWDRTVGEDSPVFDTGVELQLDKISGGGSIVIHSK